MMYEWFLYCKFSSGTKYIRLTNPVPYLEEEEEMCNKY